VERVLGIQGRRLTETDYFASHPAESLYAKHLDKNWSLTDCHSMELMRARRLRDVATADAAFGQAGFRCLLKG